MTVDLKTDIIRSSLAICKICLQLPSEPSVLFSVVVSWGRWYSVIGEKFFWSTVYVSAYTFIECILWWGLDPIGAIWGCRYSNNDLLRAVNTVFAKHFQLTSLCKWKLPPFSVWLFAYRLQHAFPWNNFWCYLFKRSIFNVARGRTSVVGSHNVPWQKLPPVRGLLGCAALCSSTWTDG